ncbi:type VII secretion protein EccB [Nocardia sp. NEAU-G5]|uniref:Type VII secretion protein EccB n=1 Tax=Nocardia albiluteola TaxID=2842303 RepID=A0ABS6B3M7_9NOCA|nr:type VII secretion protein EccB [Nocardia albiluteola]MBU3064910.1 type VII secretion protein EccB [Nocardia albiluteola]
MPTQLTTRAQVSGYRFLLKRFEHALIRRDVRMLHDPMAVQFRALMVSMVLGVLALGACAVLGLLRPQGAVGNAHIIVGKDSSALYVLRDGTLHPVLNLASARLVAGAAETPTSVKESQLASYPRGPLVGIPGAPDALPGSDAKSSDWTMCESVTPVSGASRIVVAGRPALGPGLRALDSGDALLVASNGTNYLLFDGKRAQVDLANDATVRSLKLQGIEPRTIGSGLLDATVPIPALSPPVIPQLGKPSPVPGVKIGAVIRVSGTSSTDVYVALADGVQPISPLAADFIRNDDSLGMDDVIAVPPDALRGIPVVSELPLGAFPAARPRLLSGDDLPVACVAWSRSSDDGNASLRLLAGSSWPMPPAAVPVGMVSGGVDPSRIDAAYLAPSSGEFVQSTGIAPDSTRRDSLFYITDNGIRYGIPDTATAGILGLTGKPKLAPWEIIGQLVPGPELTPDAAQTAYDTLPRPNQR